ncbi:NAD-dependent epimerase/dehydratase family protein [Haladaptatus sp. GCM10025707]|uniref:NAD-dependent epimerase/dehydratase family protein n=1 Tax=unclassified Haladaptatus TaxID=2622732 RepID=UPI0023E80118|nr:MULTISPECIES: NAD-dependent epimerase/dehydratase family protein [unclassified Haladaptatus]
MSDPLISGQTVLVTGGAGFIGSHLVDALVSTNAVRVLDDFSTGSRANLPSEVTVFEGDVRDVSMLRDAMDGVDLVFHEAGFVSVKGSIEAPYFSNLVNANATVAVLELAREYDARVVTASSAAIYGAPEVVPIGEDARTAPDSPYGIDKLASDHYARAYNRLYGLDTVALRYFNVYGPRQTAGDYSGVISTFVKQATNGGPITVHGDGSQTRDFVHVSDVVQANLLAATTDHTGQAFNVGTGQALSIIELAELIRNLADSGVKIQFTEPRTGDIKHSCADITRVRDDLGFTAQVPLDVGLRGLVEGAQNVQTIN